MYHISFQTTTKMPPLEWDKVMAAKATKLSDDEVEEFYESFLEVNMYLIITSSRSFIYKLLGVLFIN